MSSPAIPLGGWIRLPDELWLLKKWSGLLPPTLIGGWNNKSSSRDMVQRFWFERTDEPLFNGAPAALADEGCAISRKNLAEPPGSSGKVRMTFPPLTV